MTLRSNLLFFFLFILLFVQAAIIYQLRVKHALFRGGQNTVSKNIGVSSTTEEYFTPGTLPLSTVAPNEIVPTPLPLVKVYRGKTGKERAEELNLPKPPKISISDILFLTHKDGSDAFLQNGTYGSIFIAYYLPLKQLVAYKVIKESVRNKVFANSIYLECAVGIFLKEKNAFATECFGLIDDNSAIFELLLIPNAYKQATKPSHVHSLYIKENFYANFTHLTPAALAYILQSSQSDPIRQIGDGWGKNRWLKIACQMSSAVAILHEAGIIHRDLKTKNIMIDFHNPKGPAAKIADFTVTGPKINQKVWANVSFWNANPDLLKKEGGYWNEKVDLNLC